MRYSTIVKEYNNLKVLSLQSIPFQSGFYISLTPYKLSIFLTNSGEAGKRFKSLITSDEVVVLSVSNKLNNKSYSSGMRITIDLGREFISTIYGTLLDSGLRSFPNPCALIFFHTTCFLFFDASI